MHRIIYNWTNIKFHLTLFFTVNPTKESNKIPNSYIEILAQSSYYNKIIFCVFFLSQLCSKVDTACRLCGNYHAVTDDVNCSMFSIRIVFTYNIFGVNFAAVLRNEFLAIRYII